MESVLLDATGHRRSPATMPGHHRGRPPGTKGEQYPADRPTVGHANLGIILVPPRLKRLFWVAAGASMARHRARARAVRLQGRELSSLVCSQLTSGLGGGPAGPGEDQPGRAWRILCVVVALPGVAE